jgi:16S rRNA (guanine527-N7)-methyltransferase
MSSRRPPEAVIEASGVLGVSRESWVRIEQFIDLLLTWQKRINLISPAGIPDIWERHVLDSLQLLSLFPAGVSTIADLGSGSGFPAIPLAIASGRPFHLYESNHKKAAFLREALRVTGSAGHVHPVRLDGTTTRLEQPHVELVTARALAPLGQLIGWALPFLENGAQALFPKGEHLDQELTEAEKYWRIRYTKHPSRTDSRAVILAVQEVSRVASKPD